MPEPFQSREFQDAIKVAEEVIGDKGTALRVVKALVIPFWNVPWETWVQAHEVVRKTPSDT